MSLSSSYNCTLKASYAGYVVQAIVNNFAPLLFLTFQDTFGISLGMITMLVTVNFGIQLLVDFLSARFVDRIGYRTCIVAAHVFTAAGLAGGTGLYPGSDARAFCGPCGMRVPVCGWGRYHRSADQPHCGGMPHQ